MLYNSDLSRDSEIAWTTKEIPFPSWGLNVMSFSGYFQAPPSPTAPGFRMGHFLYPYTFQTFTKLTSIKMIHTVHVLKRFYTMWHTDSK